MRLFLSEDLKIKLNRSPNDKITAYGVSLISKESNSKILDLLNKKAGLNTICHHTIYFPGSIGCNNKCDFCCTSAQFEGSRLPLYSTPEELADNMIKQFQLAKHEVISNKKSLFVDEADFWIQDENITKSPDNLERICSVIEKSGENIHWGASTDVAGLYEYKQKHGSFINLLRGGIFILWVGIESKADVYEKRGQATHQDVESIVKELQNLGIIVIGSFQSGLPIHTEGETIIKEDGTYQALNIHEDADWAIGLNTGAHQYNIFSYLNAVRGRKKMYQLRTRNPNEEYDDASMEFLGTHDDDIGHTAVSNISQIPSNYRLEEIDRDVRRRFYRENGPVAIRVLLTQWDGFMNLKDSAHPADIRQATFLYWSAKSYFHLISLATPILSNTVFEKMSDKFSRRLAKALDEMQKFSPIENELNSHYISVVQTYQNQISPFFNRVGEMLRNNFLNNYLLDPAK